MASAHSHLAHHQCGRATYRVQSHYQCAIAPGSHQVQICHIQDVPCAVSLTPSVRSHLAHIKCRRATYRARSHCHVQCKVALLVRGRNRLTSSADEPCTMRGLTATYRAHFHCQCAIATGSRGVQTSHVPCAVSLPVRDRTWLPSSADLPRRVRGLTATYRAQSHCRCVIATGSPQVQTSHVRCAVSLPRTVRSFTASA